jgi:hypothetical protein
MWMYAAIVGIQVLTVIHIVRSGRTNPWLYVVVFLPLVGSVAYLVAEVLPELLSDPAAQRAREAMRDRVDPERRLRALRSEAEEIGTPQSFAALAEELARLGRTNDAVAAYRRAMTGLFAHDPDLHFALAKTLVDAAEQDATHWQAAAQAVQDLSALDAVHRPGDQTLLQARLALGTGDVPAADRLFRHLTEGFPSVEVSVRYAHFLYTHGKVAEARSLLEQVQALAKRSTAHVRRMNAYWFDQADVAMRTLTRGGGANSQ